MSEPKFTPGPWVTDISEGRQMLFVRTAAPEGAWICGEIDNDDRHEENQANARLIAAAPDLYEAARIVLAELNARIDAAPSSAKPVFRGIVELHTAIAKANGETDSEHRRGT